MPTLPSVLQRQRNLARRPACSVLRNSNSFFFLGGIFGSLDTSAMVALGDSCHSEDGVSLTVRIFFCNSNILGGLGLGSTWKNSSTDLGGGSWSLKSLSSGVIDLSLLGLAFLEWEQDELGLVGAQSFGVELQLLG